MRRNPLFIFKDLDSIGIYDIPLKSTVHILNVGLDDNNVPMPLFIQLLDKIGLNQLSTIQELLNVPENYINLFTVGTVYSELELIQEDGIVGWRILNRDPENYGKIGAGAFDFSFNNIKSIKHGALGAYSAAWGQGTKAWGANSTANGDRTTAGYDNQFVVGIRNYNKAHNIFEIGIGDTATSANALEVTKEGVILAPEMDPTEIIDPRTLITKEFFESYGSTGGQLRKITESGQTGYRILGRDSVYYADIGIDAVDLSTSTSYGNTNGASGEGTFATGWNVSMRNTYGSVFGQWNDPQSGTLFEIGNGPGNGAVPRSNALEVYQDGRVRAPELTISGIDTDRSLVTREYLNNITVEYQITDIDLNVPIGTTPTTDYGITTESTDLNLVEVFVNGILLRSGRDYEVTLVPNGMMVSFASVIDPVYTLYHKDWVRIKIPIITH